MDDALLLTVHSDRVFRIGINESQGKWPGWLAESLSEFESNVRHDDYPCHFGRNALGSNELFASWIGIGQDITALAQDLSAFLDATQAFPRRRMVLAVFFQPEPECHDHEWYGEHLWTVLTGLRDLDDKPWPADIPRSPQNPRWEFSFHGVPCFVFAAVPTHQRRRSRQLGRGMVALFQPRNVFHGVEGGTPGGRAARKRIRERLVTWDAVPTHPMIGDYGDPANFEWNQYFISDDDRPLYAACPLDTAADLRLHELISAQVRRTPDAVAVVVGAIALSYRQIEQSSSLLAAQLVAKGIKPDDRVGVIADRSADTVISVLAVLKAGAAYVPVDPAYPENRRAYLLEQSGVEVVLTPRRLVASVPAGPRWLLLSDEQPNAVPAGGASGAVSVSTAAPVTAVRPDNLAYVIYTSGSTGRPKGVAVSHRQIVQATWAQHAVDRPPPVAFLMPISFSFDASAVGMYWTLSTGGCLVLPTDAEYRDPARLRELIECYGITHTDCTPSLYDLILGADAAPLRSMQCVQVGGEMCPAELARRHMRLLPGCVFQNNYGPTETTIWATTNILGRDSAVPAAGVPIGWPRPGARVYLLDSALRPVEDGQSGELFIGGSGVARGYHNSPGMTADRFVPDPFSARQGQRLYRTGDIARRLPDGAYEFAGRRDTQVKVSGYRIELGEIETALRSHPDIAEAVVEVRPAGGERVLVGYLRMTPGRECADVALIGYLAPLLPEHMVPRRYVRMDSLPRTTSGKVDRLSLPALSALPPRAATRPSSGARASVGSSPSTPSEEVPTG